MSSPAVAVVAVTVAMTVAMATRNSKEYGPTVTTVTTVATTQSHALTPEGRYASYLSPRSGLSAQSQQSSAPAVSRAVSFMANDAPAVGAGQAATGMIA